MAGSFVDTDFSQLLGILPEILLVIWGIVVMFVDMFSRRLLKRRTLGLVATAGMIGILVVTILARPSEQANPVILGGMVRNDLFSYVFNIIFIVAGALTCLASIDFRAVRAGGEYYAIVTFSVAAMCLMAASDDLIMLFLATETASISLYLLAGFMRGSKLSAEAGIKYFVFGATASTIMLFGLSLIFGMSGSTSYQSIALALRDPALRVPVTFAALAVLVGFAFKTSAVPFHFWAPDVYTGAPTPVAGFVSTASKAAGFAILLRFMYYNLPPGTSQASLSWVSLMQPLAILTMVLGTLLALVQSNVKRMLAYSSVAQAGYILVGVTAFASAPNREDALAAVIFYIATYMLTNICAFTVVGVISQRKGGDDIKDFAGLGRSAPYLALGMVAALVSLLGAPPLVGFVAKIVIFGAAIGAGLIPLVVIGVVMVLVSTVYYLNVVRAMYVERTSNDEQRLFVPAASRAVVLVTAMAIILLAVFSLPLWNLSLDAARSFFS